MSRTRGATLRRRPAAELLEVKITN